ncbi:hypothetical protein TURU_034590 [Turdus rufiventris]|nr:hypothetical protein TURU_034590 [Turdus rufiventris]
MAAPKQWCGNGSLSTWKTVTSGVPQELVLGLTLFNIFVGNMDNEVSAPSASSLMTPSSAAVNMMEGRNNAIQKDLNRLEKWANGNLMKFNKAKCKVLRLCWGYPRNTYRLGKEVIESSPAKQDLTVKGDEKLHMSHQRMLTAQKAN